MNDRLAVLASPRGTSHLVLSGWPRRVDEDAVARVLARHELAFSRHDGEALEWVVAQDLTDEPAHALARDLESIGLYARVVPSAEARPGSWSLRSMIAGALSAVALVPGAASAVLSLAMLTVIPGVTSQVDTGRTFTEWLVTTLVLLGTAVAFGGVPVTNLWALATRGQRRLVTTARDPSQLDVDEALSTIRDVVATLPDALAAGLLERADAVAEEARRDPKGEAASELREMVAELAQSDTSAPDARALRRDLVRVRDAAREVEP